MFSKSKKFSLKLKNFQKAAKTIIFIFPKNFSFFRDGIELKEGKFSGVIKKSHVAPENHSLGKQLLDFLGSYEYTLVLTKLSRVSCIAEDYIGVTVPLSFFNLDQEKEVNNKLKVIK